MTASVIDLRAYTGPAVSTTLVLVDLERDHSQTARALAAPEGQAAVSNCRAALAHARASGFPVAFVRRRSHTLFLNARSRCSRWIEGFEPMGSDMIFERDAPSCYASPPFADVIANSAGHFVLAGFAGEAACLATAVDAFHRGHHFTFLRDASASRELGGIGSDQVHAVVTRITEMYGEVLGTRAWIAATSRVRRHQGAVYGYKQDRPT